MSYSEFDETGRRFLVELFIQTKGDISSQVSMYDIGVKLGLDKEAAARVAEGLMVLELVELRTLSGGIGITTDGLEEVRKLGVDLDVSEGAGPKLGNALILENATRHAVDHITAVLKTQAGNMGLDFEVLTELIADLKTIDAQLISSRPKTAIIRECFKSIKGVLENVGEKESVIRIKGMLGE